MPPDSSARKAQAWCPVPDSRAQVLSWEWVWTLEEVRFMWSWALGRHDPQARGQGHSFRQTCGGWVERACRDWADARDGHHPGATCSGRRPASVTLRLPSAALLWEAGPLPLVSCSSQSSLHPPACLLGSPGWSGRPTAPLHFCGSSRGEAYERTSTSRRCCHPDPHVDCLR